MPEYSTADDNSLTLDAWLSRLEASDPKCHATMADFKLEHVYSVAASMGLLNPPSAISHDFSGAFNLPNVRVVTVTGTNGKGSCCKIIEQCLLARHLNVGTFTSPHLLHYCERITINGVAVSESLVCQAFAEIDSVREGRYLTYFEFSVLAALLLFQNANLDVVLLEVGVGGCLDATNIVDADIAVITSIAMDHQQLLGNDRDAIADKKAGICRRGKPMVCADNNPPESLLMAANKCSSYWINKDFSCQQQPDKTWLWRSRT